MIIPAALGIDLVFGFVMAGVFLLLYGSLPGEALAKGLALGLLAWFFRVAMQVASQGGDVLYSRTFSALCLVVWTGRDARAWVVYGASLRPFA